MRAAVIIRWKRWKYRAKKLNSCRVPKLLGVIRFGLTRQRDSGALSKEAVEKRRGTDNMSRFSAAVRGDAEEVF